jgi:hypothetical protein
MGSCLGKTTTETESSHPLLNEEFENDEDLTRVVDRANVPHTVINLPSPGSRPLPLTYDDHTPTSELPSVIITQEGQELMRELKDAYSWRDQYNEPTMEFTYKTNSLFTSLENHFSILSAEQSVHSKSECDTLVNELLALRSYWGEDLLPLSVRNAFIRERININHDNQHSFRIDCIQFFEPILFYGNLPGKQEDLVKLFVFVVTDMENDEVIIRYYLERSFLFDFYHVLCYFKGNSRGQLKPYGTHCPSYWVIREHMYQNALVHLKSITSDNSASSIKHPIASTFFPKSRSAGPVNI